MIDAHQLLAEYARSGSERAFQELVSRYINLVYSTAVRMVPRDTADDVTQRVFADLAKVAGNLSGNVMLGGWLHRHTCYVAQKLIRSERRRIAREQAAMELNHTEPDADLAAMTPLLDEAINSLKKEDRQAILLRFFEQHEFNAVGQVLGTSEEAARKRVHRAVEKLRNLLQKRGVSLSAATVGTLLSAHAVQAAPLGLAATVSSLALTTAAAGGGTATILLHLMTMTKLQVGVIAALTIALGIPLIIQHQQKNQLRQESTALRSQLEAIEGLQQDNRRLSNLLARAVAQRAEPQDPDPSRELLKLRGEVGVLRKAVGEAAASSASSQISPLGGIAQNPQMWGALRDQQKLALSSVYKGFAKQTSLPPEKFERLGNLMADNVMTNIHHITACLRDGKTTEEMEQVFAQEERELQNQVQGLLGEEGAKQFKEYTGHLLSDVTAEQFKSMLQGDQKAKDTAALQLRDILRDESQKALLQAGLTPEYQTIPTLNFRNFASEQEAERNLELLDIIYSQAQARAAAFLKPEEVEKFGEFRKMAINNNRMALALNRKLMAPPGK